MFDPYRKWLGILPKDQPPNHYRLLGVEVFDDDLDVIEGAADRQMAFVRQYQSGEHAADAARILNELAIARLCLLKPATKAAYDEKLREELAAKPQPEEDFSDLPFSDLDLKTNRIPAVKRAKPGRAKSSGPPLPLRIGVGVAAAVSFMLILFLFSGPRPQSVHKNMEADQVAATATGKTDIPEPPRINDGQPKATGLTSQMDVPLSPAKILTVQKEATQNDAGTVNNPAIPAKQESTFAAQSSSRPKEGEWVDLLEWSEGVDWAPRGINWNQSLEGKPTRNGITLKAVECNRFPLAAVIDGDYELEVEFTRHEGTESVGGIFPVGIHNMWFEVSAYTGTIAGVGCIDGKWYTENSTGRRPSTITNNERHQFTIRVHNDGNRAAFHIDWDQTRDFIKWDGPTAALTNMANRLREVTNTRHVWLASYSSRSTFHKVRIRMLSGTIRRDIITDEDRKEDLQNGFVRLVGEKHSHVKVGSARFVVNQADMTEPGATEQRWPLITRDFRFCDDYYGAHAASRLKCPMPEGAKSFSVVGYNDSSRTAKYVVLIDGKQVHDSGETGFAVIKVDIPAKASLLELVADPVRWYDFDRTYWCFPRFHAVAAERVTDDMLDGKLGTLKFRITSSKVQFGELTHNQPIKDQVSNPVHFRDAQPCDEFLFAHAPSTVTYQVPDGMTRFTAIGYNTMSQSVKYEIWANSHRVYESPQAGIVPIDVQLPPDTRAIELKIADLGNYEFDHSFWCYPRLHRK